MSGKRAALPCGHRLAHPDRGLRMLLEPSSLSGKVTSNNGSAGHRDPTGGLRCPGDELRHNELVFYAEMTGDCLQRTKPLRSSHGTPCCHHKGVITEQQASSRPLPAGAWAIPSSPRSVGPAWSPAPCALQGMRPHLSRSADGGLCRHASEQTHLGTAVSVRRL